MHGASLHAASHGCGLLVRHEASDSVVNAVRFVERHVSTALPLDPDHAHVNATQ